MKYFRPFIYLFLAVVLTAFVAPVLSYSNLSGTKLTLNDAVASYKSVESSGQVFELFGTVRAYENFLIKDINGHLEDSKSRSITKPWKASEGVNYATLYFKINDLSNEELYGLYMQDALTAYEVYVNGEKVASQGRVSTTKSQSMPEAKSQHVVIKPKAGSAEVVIWLSNFEADRMGIWQKTYFGTLEDITRYEERANISDAFGLGAILFISIYMWILFIVLNKDRTILYFALSCTFISIKSFLSGQQIGFETYSFLSYDLGLRLAYLMVVCALMAFIAYVRCYFREETNRWFCLLSLGVSVVESLIILLTPQSYYMSTFWLYQLFIVFSCIVIIYWVVRAFRAKKEGAGLYLVGFIALFGFVINDILYSQMIIHTGYCLSTGLLLLILAQATLIAMRVSSALNREAFLNQNLERMIEERTKDLEDEKNRFENLSKVDGLTLVYNKGYLMEVLSVEYESCQRYNGVLSVMMIDLDHFKVVNDTYGHVVGDEVLKRVAAILKDHSRRSDIVGRFGGEEFLIILRFTILKDANAHAESLRQKIENMVIETEKGPLRLTSSFGVAEFDLNTKGELNLIKKADEALYRAKSGGRNKVSN